ncbi:MAG: hypothetical protein QMD71_08230 [bacterium]|nr:hypothetical protein [bacterium]
MRKGIHLTASLIPLSYYLFSRFQFITFISFIAVIALIMEYLRFKNIKFKSLFYRAVGKLLWDKESKTLTGATAFIIGALICAIFFLEKPVVVSALLFLTVGDTSAYLVGNTIGKIKIFGKKTLEGGFILLLVSIVIVRLIPGMKLTIGLIGAVVACIVELLPWDVDDNLSIPIISGAVMEFILKIAGS